MRVRARFEVEVAPPYGAPRREHEDLPPIDRVVDGSPIRIVPVSETTHEVYDVDDDGHGTAGEDFTALVRLEIEVAQECDDAGPTKEQKQAAESVAADAARLA